MISLDNLSDKLIGEHISLQGRIHDIRKAGSMCFIVLRDRTYSIQAIGIKKLIKESFKELTKVTRESVIMISGVLKETDFDITATYYKKFEIVIENWKIISLSKELPFQLKDADDGGVETFRSDVLQHTRLNHRWLDLRTPVNYNIFKLQSLVCKYFREYLSNNDFIIINKCIFRNK